MDILSEKITKYYKNQKPPKNDTLFTDDLFPPNINSLLSLDKSGNFIDEIDGKKNSTRINPSEIVWKRASEIFESDYTLFENSIEVNDIKQGDLGNCYFLSSLAALTNFPNLIYQIFKTKTVNIYGYYEIILCIDGEFQIVLLDDYFPVEKDNIRNLKFAKPNNNEIWVLLIEKAWAKINGGYSNIIGGSPRDALKALTNFAIENIKTLEYTPEELFNKIANVLRYQSIICATTSNKNENSDKGLLPNHAYTVLDARKAKRYDQDCMLIKVRNPWGFLEWNGPWNDKSSIWTKDLKDDLDFESNEKDGIFFMEINDFRRFFISIDICYLQYKSKVKICEMNHYLNLPCVYNLFVEEDEALIAISLCKKYWRFNRDMKNKIYPCTLIVCRLDKSNNCEDFIGKFESEEDVEICTELKQGLYIVYIYYAFDQSSDPKLDKFFVKISSNYNYKFLFLYFDYNFSFLKYMILSYLKIKRKEMKKKTKLPEISSYTSTDFYGSGIGYRAVINRSKDKVQMWDNSLVNIKNMFLLPPYHQVTEKFRFEVGPKCSRIILGMKKDKYDSYWFNLSSIFTDVKVKDLNTPKNMYYNAKNGNFTYEQIDDSVIKNLSPFIIDNIEHVHMEYNYVSIPLNVASKSTMVIDSDLEQIKMENANIVRKLVSLCRIVNDKNLKWRKIVYDDYCYIGQFSTEKNKREGRGAIVFKNKTYSIGYWKDDMMTGFGKEYDKTNFCLFRGNYVKGIKQGLGTIYKKKYNNSNKNIVFHGIFNNGQKNGFGVHYYKSGERWEGQFIKGRKHGKGLFYPDIDSLECYCVEYNNDIFINK